MVCAGYNVSCCFLFLSLYVCVCLCIFLSFFCKKLLLYNTQEWNDCGNNASRGRKPSECVCGEILFIIVRERGTTVPFLLHVPMRLFRLKEEVSKVWTHLNCSRCPYFAPRREWPLAKKLRRNNKSTERRLHYTREALARTTVCTRRWPPSHGRWHVIRVTSKQYIADGNPVSRSTIVQQ